VEARNNYGSASATIVITIEEGAITSGTSIDGIVGVPLTYQVAANNNPNRYSASSLPSGLHFDSTLGVIFGTPTGAGIFQVVVEARNNYGSASGTIVITIKEPTIIGSAVALTISRTGDSFAVAWPVTSDGFILEETQLQQSTWSNSSATVATNGNQNVAVLPPQSTAKFFRLRKSSQ
jgi:hypothetical protein